MNPSGTQFYIHSDGSHFLYRASDSGSWKITTDQSNIAMNHGVVRSLGKADLPTSEGLRWYPADVNVAPL